MSPSRTLLTPGTDMAAAVIDRFGPPSVLHLGQVPVPEPGPNDVLIALHAAGVGSWDESVRDGSWKMGRTRFPLVIGSDGAGVVVAKGSRVKRFRIGDHVFAASTENAKGGYYAQYIAVSEAHVVRAPRGLDFLHAAAAVYPGLTALRGVNDILGVRRGEMQVRIFGSVRRGGHAGGPIREASRRASSRPHQDAGRNRSSADSAPRRLSMRAIRRWSTNS